MSDCPIFDRLYEESDDTTRALVWDAVRPPTITVNLTANVTQLVKSLNAIGASFAASPGISGTAFGQHVGRRVRDLHTSQEAHR